MPGSALNPHSSCTWKRRDSYFLMILMSLISSAVLVSSVSLVSHAGAGSEAEAAALSAAADPHSSEQADTPTQEKAATNVPKIESVAGRRTFHIGDTAQLECIVKDLEPFTVIWRKGLKTLLYAGSYKISHDERINSKNSVLEITNLTEEDAGEYVCQLSTMPAQEIVYDLKIVPALPRDQTTATPPGHTKPHAKNSSSHPSLGPSSSVACSSVTGIALLSLFFNNYFVRQA